MTQFFIVMGVIFFLTPFLVWTFVRYQKLQRQNFAHWLKILAIASWIGGFLLGTLMIVLGVVFS